MDDMKIGGNRADDAAGWLARVAVIEQRLDDHDDEIGRNRDAIELLGPKVTRLESTVSNLAEKVMPELILAVKNLTAAVDAWSATSSILKKIAGWTFGVIATAAIGVLSAKLSGWF